MTDVVSTQATGVSACEEGEEGEGCQVKRVTGCERINTVVILSIINMAHHITLTRDVKEHMLILDITSSPSIYHPFLWKTSCHIELV